MNSCSIFLRYIHAILFNIRFYLIVVLIICIFSILCFKERRELLISHIFTCIRLVKCLLCCIVKESIFNFIFKCLLDILFINRIYCLIHCIPMLILRRGWCLHSWCITVFITAVHDISHVKCINLCKIIIQCKKFLHFRFCSGFFYSFQSFISYTFYCITIVFYTILISKLEVQDHTSYIIVCILSTTYIIN